MSKSKTPTGVKKELPPNNEAEPKATMEVKLGEHITPPTEKGPAVQSLEQLQGEVKELKESNEFLLGMLITLARKADDMGFQQMALSRAIADALKKRKMAE